jgi:hypothetical protein
MVLPIAMELVVVIKRVATTGIDMIVVKGRVVKVLEGVGEQLQPGETGEVLG